MFIVPALTPELSFCLKHWQQLDAISEDRTGIIQEKVGSELRELVNKIYGNGGRDIKDRIIPITESITAELRGMARIDWSLRKIEDYWGACGNLYRPHGRKNLIGYLGTYYVDWHETPYVVLVTWPKGGNDGQKQLVEECREKWKGSLIMTKNEPEDWPVWEQEPGVVFEKYALSAKTSVTELKADIGRTAKDFIRIAIPVLQKLAVPIR